MSKTSKKELVNWKAFEYYAIDYHRNNYKHIVYHWDNCSEDILYQCGYITDFNLYRLTRVSSYKEGIRNNYRDYGVDAIAYDEKSNIFHILQMKCYKKTSYITASDLASFSSIFYNRIQTKNKLSNAFIYHTCRIEKILSIDTKERPDSPFIYEKLSFDNDTDINNINNTNNIDEKDYKLYKHQIDAIDFIINKKDENILLLNIVCGGGKTLILSNSLKKIQYKCIIIIAPLLLLVEQLNKRVEWLNRNTHNYKKNKLNAVRKEKIQQLFKYMNIYNRLDNRNNK